MKKNQKGFSLIEILIVVVVVGLLTATVWLVYSRQHNSNKQTTPTQQATSNSVESAADAFLISKVGSDRFHQYYMFDKSRSSYANPKDSIYDFMAYHFSPLKVMSGDDDIIMVQVNRNSLKEVFADSVPDCVKNTSLCEFKVNKSAALTIAKQNSLTAPDVQISWHTGNDQHAKEKGLPFVIVASSCTQSKSVFIDYRSGAVIGTESNCGPTN